MAYFKSSLQWTVSGIINHKDFSVKFNTAEAFKPHNSGRRPGLVAKRSFTIHVTWAVVHANETPHKYLFKSNGTVAEYLDGCWSWLLHSNYGCNDSGDFMFHRSTRRDTAMPGICFPLLQNNPPLHALLNISKLNAKNVALLKARVDILFGITCKGMAVFHASDHVLSWLTFAAYLNKEALKPNALVVTRAGWNTGGDCAAGK